MPGHFFQMLVRKVFCLTDFLVEKSVCWAPAGPQDSINNHEETDREAVSMCNYVGMV